jgi:hypothetical protein
MCIVYFQRLSAARKYIEWCKVPENQSNSETIVHMLDALSELPTSNRFDASMHNPSAVNDTAGLTNELWTLLLQHKDSSNSQNPNATYSLLKCLRTYTTGFVWLASRRNDPTNHVAIKLSLFQVCTIVSLLVSQYLNK